MVLLTSSVAVAHQYSGIPAAKLLHVANLIMLPTGGARSKIPLVASWRDLSMGLPMRL